MISAATLKSVGKRVMLLPAEGKRTSPFSESFTGFPGEFCCEGCEPRERVAHCSSVKLRGFSVFNDFFEG